MKTEETTSPAEVKEVKAEEAPKGNEPKKKMSLADLKVKSFVSEVKVEQMQFLKTAGG